MAYNQDNDLLNEYEALQRERADLFRNAASGGIDVLTERRAIGGAQDEARTARERRGQPADDLRVGVLARDRYMTILRDAVRFPDGSRGLYNRIIEGRSVAVLPVLGDRLVLVRLFRHGLRDWSLEFPRGGCDPGETAEAAARRELMEEIGSEAIDLVPIGEFTPGGSSLSIMAKFFVARIEAVGAPDLADGIGAIVQASVDEVETMIGNSQIIDGFSLSIFLRARLAGLI
ncbi:MAG: NUDIX hydrolase [Pseudolabrys sp.]|nr:NUDIX hydrolase [Pseudolabrys sp.]MDP2295744.1 NUDIX hydrolase [Pseudolabrys sp.]